MFSPANPHAQLQAIQAIQASDALPIDRPAFTPEQHPDPLVAEPGPGMRQIPDAEPQGGLILRPASPIPGGPTELG